MTVDRFETKGLHVEQADLTSHLTSLHQGFETRLNPVGGFFSRNDAGMDETISRIIGLEQGAINDSFRPRIMESTHQLLQGIEKNGFRTLGLNEISSWNINPDYRLQNIKQQSGYAAEVISTWKENLISESQGTGLRTFRADDLPELFQRNDQFVDKVRMNTEGQIVERIQTKFVGGNGAEWLSKVMSRDFDKYFDGAVDKLECPKNYYDEVMNLIPQRRAGLERQLERVLADGKDDVAAVLQRKIEKLNQLEAMVEKSTVSTDEAIYARLHPKAYAAKMFVTETLKVSNMEGLKSGAFAAGLTFAVSTADNIGDFINGKIDAGEMAMNVLEETAAAGALGYGTTFVATAVSQAMKGASSQLIRSVGSSCLPAAVVSFAVESYSDISDYAQGLIDGSKLAYNLGENASMVAGGIEGAAIGATIGSVVGPVGSVAGGIVGGVVGCVVASEIYETAVELGVQGAEIIAQKATELANVTIDAVKEYVPDCLDSLQNAFNDFFATARIPFVEA